MLTLDEQERIRRAYYLEYTSLRAIARETGHSFRTVSKVVTDAAAPPVPAKLPRQSPVFGPYRARVEELLQLNEHLPRKQRYTVHKLYELLRAEGYQGCESRIGQVRAQWSKQHRAPNVYIPLEFEPGQDAQCDWGEAVAVIAGRRQTVQVFVMRLNFSGRSFVMAFPSQKQESFFYGHAQAFKHFGGVPHRISYDNLATAVKLAVEGKGRREQRAFVSLRSHYLFESHFCTPGQPHEKGGVEQMVGFARRNYFVPMPEVSSFEELNLTLLQKCLQEDHRRLHRRELTFGQAWEQERPYLRTLPPFEYDCCDLTSARLTPYSQVVYETNRYSVPVHRARREIVLKAYPFHLELYDQTTLLARHPRCYDREQDIFDPLHYLPLLEQRPGAFEHAKPLRRWREGWPEPYHRLLRSLRETWPEGRGVQEFVRILQLHQNYSPALVEGAIEQALSYGCGHFDGVWHCLHQLITPENIPTSQELMDCPQLHDVGNQPIDLRKYERLLQSLP